MKIFKSHKHAMCFRSLWECWWERSPTLISIMILSIYVPLANFLFETIIGKLHIDTETSRNISDGTLTVVYQHLEAVLPVQMIVYSIFTATVIALSFIIFHGLRVLLNEIRTIPATIKECQCEQDEK